MTEVQTSKKLPGNTKLWRYVSLDKFIDLVSTNELFFSPLASFAQTDPFEGYLPSVALDAHASISRKYVEDLQHAHQQLANHRANRGFPLTPDEVTKLSVSVDDLRTSLRRLLPAIAKTTTVNCWHASDSESEAMWRLYSDNGKAVAVETTLDALKEGIQMRDYPAVVHIYPVKYLDFFDPALTPPDCVAEGHLAPLLKRISYEHEREVRAFIGKVAPAPRTGADVNFWQPSSIRLPVDVKTLVKGVHVSPYAKEPFQSSVSKIADIFGLDTSVVQISRLLSGHEELLDRLVL